jgi:tRNA pseudouridine55 synthase
MDGILVIDKPKGLTSHDVVNSVRRIALTRKVGHAGTLDPFATGVLVVGFNQGTKILPFLQEEEKEYEAILRLGVETDTLDRDGKVLKESPCPDISREEIDGILSSFLGRQSQVPPKYSAIKREGVPLYKLARRGLEVEVPSREVEIYGMSLLSLDLPYVSFRVRCSSGTYVRSLARDIGIKAGCGGHLTSLRRIRSGRFGVETAIPLERLKEMRERWHQAAIGLRDALSLPEIEIDPEKAWMIRNGREFTVEERVGTLHAVPSGRFMIACNKSLVAVAEEGEGKRLRMIRVFNP